MKSFEASSFVFNKTDDNNSFSILTASHWSSRGAEETINRLQQLLKLISENDNKLHVEEVRKKGDQIKIWKKEYKSSDLDNQKNEILEKLKNIEFNGPEDIAFKMEWTYHEFAEIVDTKNIVASTERYTLAPG